MKYIEVEVEGVLPHNVLGPARTALNKMLDRLVGSAWMPLSIGRLDLRLKETQEPLVHHFLMPFDGGLRLGPLGGMDSIPIFSPYESLIREAVASGSPFYRFLCAFRLYEGMNELRLQIKKIRDRLSLTEKLPSDPSVDIEMLRRLGATPAFLLGIKTVRDLHARLTESRNRVAHFLLKGAKFVVSTSDGVLFMDYALSGAILLHYAHTCLNELRRYYLDHLDEKLSIGRRVLPFVEKRDQFVVRTEEEDAT